MNECLLQSTAEGFQCRHGKVRDVYDIGNDQLIIVATDRISAFDWVLPTGIPDKGKVLTQLSTFWFESLGFRHHLISTNTADMPAAFRPYADRAMLVHKTDVVPIECIVRGYLAGSGWKEYQKNGEVCGIPLPPGLVESDKLPELIFTPATKEETGHDINITFNEMCRRIGAPAAYRLRSQSIAAYHQAAAYAFKHGIIIADTKFEWGYTRENELILIDEILTPDSSRFWPAILYYSGGPQPSFDKQYVRDWLEKSGWNKNSPPPELPPDIVAATRGKYIEAYERLTQASFAA